MTDARPTLSGPLTVHRVLPDGSLGEQVGEADIATATAAVLRRPIDDADAGSDAADGPQAGATDIIDVDGPTPPELPLALADADGISIPVMDVHESTQSPAIAFEVDGPFLVVPPEDPDAPRRFPGRSVWCVIFPRMRGC